MRVPSSFLGRKGAQLKAKVEALAIAADGVTAAVTAVTLPVMVMFAALAVDLSHHGLLEQKLEVATDTAALHLASQASATRQRSAILADTSTLTSEIPTAIAMGVENLPANNAISAIEVTDITVGEWDFAAGQFNDTPPFRLVNAVRVSGELSVDRGNEPPSFFSKLIGRDVTIRSTSYAYVPPIPNIHTLHRSAANSLSITGHGDIDAFDAWVDSSSSSAVRVDTQSYSGWGGAAIFTPGKGVTGGTAAWLGVADDVVEDMFILGDLLAGTPDPDFRSCTQVRASGEFSSCRTYLSHVVDETGDVELEPGVYRGGLEIKAAQSVTMKPGVYVFDGGPLKITGPMSVKGEDVFLYFTGNDARIVHENGRLSVKGLETGTYQGFAIYSDRQTTSGERHEIKSIFDIVGTFYAPTNDVAFTSAYLYGSCHSLCFVSETFSAHNALLNVYPDTRIVRVFSDYADFPAPLSLQPALRPVLTIEVDSL